MHAERLRHDLDDLAHDLDMLVFRLERSPHGGADDLLSERTVVRRELERLRSRARDLATQA